MSVRLVQEGNRWIRVVLVGFCGTHLRWERCGNVAEANSLAATWRRALGME